MAELKQSTLFMKELQHVNTQQKKNVPDGITSGEKHLYMGVHSSGWLCASLWGRYSMVCWDLSRLQNHKVETDIS